MPVVFQTARCCPDPLPYYYHHTGRAIERDSYRPSDTLAFLLFGGFVLVAVLLAVYLLATA